MHYDNDCKEHNQKGTCKSEYTLNGLHMVVIIHFNTINMTSKIYSVIVLLLFNQIFDNDSCPCFQRTTEDFKPEDHELFLNAGRTCIAQGDSSQLLDFIKEEANQVNLEALA